MGIDSNSTSQSCTPCEFREPLGRTVLNSLSAHIAVLDENGQIIETNRAWQNFARNGGIANPNFIGINYLTICDDATGSEAADAHAVAEGIRSVIRGEVNEFLYDYPCHSPTGKHWFYMRAIKLENDGHLRVIVSHEEITALKLAEEALTENKRVLEEQKQHLEEANIAMKVLLKQRENDKLELEQNVLLNLKNLVLPYLEKLKIAPLRPKDKTLIGIIESRLNDIISPLLQHSVSANIILTPQEIQIAMLIKDGKSSKEIADILNVSETTVHFHRKNIRKKYGLKKKSTNLRSYLLSLS